MPYTEEKDNIQVVFELSKDAMIGFGTALIRLYNKGFPEKIDIRTEPLESVGGGNQPLGFWLTCESTSLYVYHKEFDIKNDSMLVKYEHNLIVHNSKVNLSYLVDLEWDDDYLESYMLGFDNIAKLTIYNGGINITKKKEVIINFSREALLETGVELIRRAHEYKSEIVYDDMLGMNYINNNIQFKILAKTFPNIRVF